MREPVNNPEVVEALQRRRPLSALAAGALLGRLFFRQTLGRRRSLWIGLVLLAVLGVALWGRTVHGEGGQGFFLEMSVNVLLQFLALGVPLYLGVSAVRDEVEDRTLVYLLARPVERWAILAGKLAAVVAVVSLGLGLLAALMYLVAVSADGLAGLAAGLPLLARVAGVLTLGCLAYTGLFGLCGVLFRHPMIPALVVAFGWEGAVSNLPGAFPRMTLMYYLKSLLGLGPEAQGLLALLLPPEALAPWPLALAVLVGAAGLLFGLAIGLGARKEFTA